MSTCNGPGSVLRAENQRQGKSPALNSSKTSGISHLHVLLGPWLYDLSGSSLASWIKASRRDQRRKSEQALAQTDKAPSPQRRRAAGVLVQAIPQPIHTLLIWNYLTLGSRHTQEGSGGKLGYPALEQCRLCHIREVRSREVEKHVKIWKVKWWNKASSIIVQPVILTFTASVTWLQPLFLVFCLLGSSHTDSQHPVVTSYAPNTRQITSS